ncbi:hypothetical protein F4861DRAFT_270906 [Xylaria intraflava]|nr:hypothetical protein F4861DRAFT_270906 [Xylaria intraflava]
MAFRLSSLGLPTSPYQLVTLFLGIAYLLHAVTFFPPSSLVYMVRADFSDDSNVVTSTAWLSTVGHCIADANKGVSRSGRSFSQCSYTIPGYNIAEFLEQRGVTTRLTPGSSFLKTQPLAILNAITMTLGLLSIMAYQLIWRYRTRYQRRTHWGMYIFSLGSTLLAFLVSVITFAHEDGFLYYIVHSYPTETATYTATYGPAAYAVMWALPFELIACAVGFYTCIGGKYECEGEMLEVDADADADTAGNAIAHSILDEKCSL